MLLTITNTGPQATDLGYLLHKNPANFHSAEVSFGKAHVFYTAAEAEACTACLLLEIDPIELVRDGQQLEQYVNDRPYVASSYLTVAISRVFGTALAGNCQKRPGLLAKSLALTLEVEAVRSRGGADVLRRLFEPLGYRVEAVPIVLDPQFPEWGESRYFRLTLSATISVHDALSHLYVLLPVLDEEKHYFIGEAEVEKLLRHGEGWLSRHPEREFIVSRYLRRWPSLVESALTRLLSEESPAIEAVDAKTNQALSGEKDLERPMTLHTQRINQVAQRLKELGAKSILDLGCGEGKLLRRLLADRTFERVCGMDVSHRSLEVAAARLKVERMPERQRRRLTLFQGSLLYRDERLHGFDAAALVEVIEHLDRPRLRAMERVVFEFARPNHVLITTPNREYNPLFEGLPEGKMRHGDHRFEWTRGEFESWAGETARRFRYSVSFHPVGPVDQQQGAPTQMAVFSLTKKDAA